MRKRNDGIYDWNTEKLEALGIPEAVGTIRSQNCNRNPSIKVTRYSITGEVTTKRVRGKDHMANIAKSLN